MTRRVPSRHRSGSSRQRGVVLFVAIIVLVAMTLAGLAMMRHMGVGTSIAGNVAFKENATSVADRGTEAARAWLTANQAILNNDNLPAGYHSSWAASVDPTTFNWAGGSVQLPAEVGNVASVYIERLCETPNLSALAPTQVCSDKPVGTGASRGGGSYPSVLPPTPPQPYFRVTTRVDGPRNTRSYTQVLMQ
jgi:type IV pilus assembly protein PilX